MVGQVRCERTEDHATIRVTVEKPDGCLNLVETVGHVLVDNIAKMPTCYGLFVNPDYRQHGIAISILTKVKEEFGAFRLFVWKDNIPAVALYRKFGMIETEGWTPSKLCMMSSPNT